MPRAPSSSPERPKPPLSPRMAQAVVLAQEGLNARQIAEEIARQDGSEPMDARSVRRLLSDARKRGARTAPPDAPARDTTPQDAATGRFRKGKPARASVITVTKVPGGTEISYRQTAEQRRRARLRDAQRARRDEGLGPEVAVGEVTEINGRMMVKTGGALIEDTGPRQDAIGGYYADLALRREIEQARAEGYETVHLTYPDGSIREVDLTEDVA